MNKYDQFPSGKFYCREHKKSIDEISLLRHRIQYFDSFNEDNKICVVRELNDILHRYADDNNQSINWDYEISETE